MDYGGLLTLDNAVDIDQDLIFVGHISTTYAMLTNL